MYLLRRKSKTSPGYRHSSSYYSQLLAIEKVRTECKRRFGKALLLQTEIKEEIVFEQKES